MTTVTILTGEQVNEIYTPVNAFNWGDLGNVPFGSWSTWNNWRITTSGAVSIQLDDDLFSSDFRIPYVEVLHQGDLDVNLKISDTGTFTGEETSIDLAFETPENFVKGRYYRWTLTVTSNSEFSTPVIQFYRTIYEDDLYVETLEDVDVFANSTTSLSTNLGLVRNIQATALQGDPYVLDGYVITAQGSDFTRTPATVTNSGSTIVDGFIDSAFEFSVDDTEAILVTMAQELPQGTSDFTVETYIYVDDSFLTSGGPGWIIYGEPDSASDGEFFVSVEDRDTFASIQYQIQFDGAIVSPLQAPINLQITTETWHHWAIVRTGGTIKMYLDGLVIDTRDLSSANAVCDATTNDIIIGGNNFNNGFIGKIDELRISNTARYTSNFTPETSRFTNDPDTSLLLHAEDYTDDGGTVYGSDPYFIEQRGGSPVINSKNPPQVQVVDYNGDPWDGTVDVVLRGYPKIQLTSGGVFPLAV